CGLTRIDPDSGIAVLDSPLGILGPRLTAAGWHLVPPGLLRLTPYPSVPVTLSFRAGADDRSVLVTREGIEVTSSGTIRYRINAGRLPNLGRLVRAGARGRLHSITPMLSPVIWTSIATGVSPGRHGIIDFLATTGKDGEKVPVTSSLRKTKALWNILSEQGLSVGIAGWWASFPAEKVNGFVVSDRVAYQLFGARAAHDPVKEGKVFAGGLGDLVASLTVAPETIGTGEISRYVRLPDDPAAVPADQNRLIDDLKTLLAAGDTYTSVSLVLRERYHPDFQAVYLEGTDTVA